MGASPKTIPNEFVEEWASRLDARHSAVRLAEIAVRAALDFVMRLGQIVLR